MFYSFYYGCGSPASALPWCGHVIICSTAALQSLVTGGALQAQATGRKVSEIQGLKMHPVSICGSICWCKLIIDICYTARSGQLEPPRLGWKCGKWVERLSDFWNILCIFQNHTTPPPTYSTLREWGKCVERLCDFLYIFPNHSTSLPTYHFEPSLGRFKLAWPSCIHISII